LFKKTSILLLISLIVFFISYNFYPEPDLPAGKEIDSLVVLKAERHLYVYSKSQLLKIYKIALSDKSIGGKEIEGDRKTPEGSYYITDKNPNSGYHKNLGVSYPNQKDIDYAQKLGKSPGDNIKIHGIRNGMGFLGKFHRWRDWTLGCIAVTDAEIDELFEAVKIGARIEIKP
jgi:murein L,D-transpeptidase YafK